MSSGASQIIENYFFSAAVKTIAFTDYKSISLSGVKLITNVTDGIIIYQFNDATKNGSVVGNVLTLTYDTTLMSNTDTLMIVYEEPSEKSLESSVLDQLAELNSGEPTDIELSSDEKLEQIVYLLDERLPELGQKPAIMSMPVTIAADQAPPAFKTITGTFRASNDFIRLDGVGGYNTAFFDIYDSVLSATMVFEAWYQSSQTWQILNVYNQINSTIITTSTSSLPVRGYATIIGASAVRVTNTAFGGTVGRGRITASQSPSPAVAVVGGTLGTVTTVNGTISLTPGTAATNLGKAIGGTPGATDTGVAALMRRIDTPVTAYGTTALWNVPTLSVFGTQWCTLTPSTGGGCLFTKILSEATTNATSVKASAGVIHGWTFSNTAATHVFVKLFNKASAPTVGTDVPAITICVPANNQISYMPSHGIAWATGLAYAITNLGTDADTTAVLATQVLGTISYI